jgi:NAD-dependent dihydropyrimidine dehydrogenase PreA subunit
MDFEEATIKVTIDTSKCSDCTTKACVEACKVYDRGILQLNDGIPSVSHIPPEEIKRKGTECLACEYACWQRGKDAIRINVPIKGLDEYLKKRGLK